MTLFDKVKAVQLQARKDRNAVAVAVLTTLIGDLTTAAKNSGQEITDGQTIALVKKYIDNADFVLKQDVTATQPIAEKVILSQFLPSQLSEADLRTHISTYIETLITAGEQKSGKLTGKIMSYLKGSFEGQYDGKLASTITKELLA